MMTVVVSAEEIYRGLSTKRTWVERALLVLAEQKAFVGLMADELERLAGKLQAGMELTYAEFQRARAELRRETYVAKLVKIAMQTKAPEPVVPLVGEEVRKPARPAGVPAEPAWLRDEPRLAKGSHFYDPPKWVNVRFAQRCNQCGAEIEQGAVSLWFPTTRGNTCMCRACGEAYEVAEKAESGRVR